MTFSAHVKDGTGAGRRRIREHEPWRCLCAPWPDAYYGASPGRGKLQPGHRYSCPDCGARRPPRGEP